MYSRMQRRAVVSTQLNPPQHLHHIFSRFVRTLIWGVIAIMIALGIGMCGYHFLEKMSWVDAFINASMILSGMGPIGSLQTDAGKIFAGLYALFSGLFFIIIVALIFSPLIHRFLYNVHVDYHERKH